LACENYLTSIDGEWISEVIDDKLYLIKEDFDDSLLERNRWLELQNRTMPADEWKTVMQTGSRALYFAQCANQNETWFVILHRQSFTNALGFLFLKKHLPSLMAIFPLLKAALSAKVSKT
jgi:hypothetical protein